VGQLQFYVRLNYPYGWYIRAVSNTGWPCGYVEVIYDYSPPRERKTYIDHSKAENHVDVSDGSTINNGEVAKCSRCRRWRTECLSNYDNLCDRCVQALLEDFPNHESIPFILENICQQRTKWLKI
jgi:hypothetical protein